MVIEVRVRARCLYNKVRYLRGFCVSGVGGMEQHGAASIVESQRDIPYLSALSRAI
jgi:hypothetical protein